MVVTWTPDSSNIVFLSRREAWNTWIAKLHGARHRRVAAADAVGSRGFLSYGPDGKQIAYNRIFPRLPHLEALRRRARTGH